MLQVQWTICIVLLSELIVVTMACPNDTCAVIDCNKTSIATQVINMLKDKRQNNNSFTFISSLVDTIPPMEQEQIFITFQILHFGLDYMVKLLSSVLFSLHQMLWIIMV